MPPLPSGSGGEPLYRPDPSNTRVLLRSLEDLRDSLSARVEQLSGAVDRLRGQASELEHAVNTGTPLAPGFGRPGPSGRIAPLITTFTTVSAGRAGARRENVGGSRVGEDGGQMSRTLHGHPPTNLTVSAGQPAPVVVRSLPVELEEEDKDGSAEEPTTESPSNSTASRSPTENQRARQRTFTSVRHLYDGSFDYLSSSRVTPDEGPSVAPQLRRRSEERPLLASLDRALSPFDPLTRSDEEDLDTMPESSWFSPLMERIERPGMDRLPPGLTTRGMMVQERQTVPSEPRRRVPMQRETDRATRDAERLDRAIARYQRRQDESQREFHTAWERERQRGIQGGRLPNEHSIARAEAMRRHVDNAHRLWNLIYQRDRLTIPSPDRPEEVDSPLPIDAMRHIMSASPTFIRRALPPRRGVGGGVPASPRPNAGELVDLERGWIDRIENERAGVDSQPTSDQYEYEYYRDFLFEDRQRRRRGGSQDSSWPAQRLRMLERLSRLRQWREEGSELFPTNARDDTANDTATRSSDSPPHSPRLAPLSPGDSPTFPALAPLSNEDDSAQYRDNRSQLLDYIEDSRARVHSMARDLNPEILEQERPGMRRVLEGIERMLSRDALGSDIRVRLESLAARERELLGDPPRAAIVPSGNAVPATMRERLNSLARPVDVLDRIDQARARVRELSRISRDLASVRADMGLEGSDAETVVPAAVESLGRLTLGDDEHVEEEVEVEVEEDKEGESGELGADAWVAPPRGRVPRPYVSLLDL